VGKPNNPISIQALSAHLFGAEASSLRTMMQQFEALPTPFDFTLDVKPQSGSTPLLVNTRYANFAGIKIRGFLPNTDGFRVLKDGQVIRVVPSQTGFAHRFDEGGQYVIEGSAQGVGRDGYARVVKTVTVDVQAPTPQTKPDLVFTGGATYNTQTKRIQISFKNIGTANAGAFRVNAQVNNVSLGELVYDSMPVGQGDTVSFDPGFLPSGDYTYNFVLDLYNTVNESNENNNGFNGIFTIP
jgi:hypothetical protein